MATAEEQPRYSADNPHFVDPEEGVESAAEVSADAAPSARREERSDRGRNTLAPALKVDDAAAEDYSSDRSGKPGGPKEWLRRHPLAIAIFVLLFIAALVAGVLWWLNAQHYESTDDAFVDARAFSVAPEDLGYIVSVSVTDNQHVAAGAVLARIDDSTYKAAVAQAAAQVQAAQANIAVINAQITGQQTQIDRAAAAVNQVQATLKFAQEDATRYNQLKLTGGGTVQQAQQTASQLLQQQANLTSAQENVVASKQQNAVLAAQRSNADAMLAEAQAQLNKAQLDLNYTTITAAQPGRLVQVSASAGEYVQPGQSLMMFVPDDIWITANFKETQIDDMRPGQPVSISIDAYPDVKFTGHVDSIQPGSGTAFSLLPAENATGNYVKVVQRIPVKIVLDKVPDHIVLGPGMSAEPTVKVR